MHGEVEVVESNDAINDEVEALESKINAPVHEKVLRSPERDH